MLKKVFASAVFGVEASTITVEVNVDKGVGYHLVGLPDNAIKESNFRIAAALQNNGYRIPGKKIIINMSPADLRKEGSAYDLTLAIGILASTDQIKAEGLDNYLIMGELSLDGTLQPIKGALPIAVKAREEGFKGFILPSQNAKEAAIVDNLEVYGVENIGQVINYFDKGEPLEQTIIDTRKEFEKNLDFPEFDFSDVKGQEGITRGGLGSVVRAERKLTSANRDTLYEANVNPIATFPQQGVVVFGQKTLQKAASALDRVNVRRLLISLKGYISQIADNLVFEQNTIATRQNFLTQVNPYLESVQQRQGLYAFKVVMDETNNTPDVIDRNELIGQIFLQPTKTAEFIILDFNVLPTGATFPA